MNENIDESGLKEQAPAIYTVSSLTEKIKTLLEDHFELVWVEAEISNFRAPGSGHYYMTFKDEGAQIRAVMFRPQTRYLKFRPEDGMKVIAQGRIGVYEPRGEYQILLDYLEPLGVGALAVAFEQLKKKLAGQGLFDSEIKKPLPYLPRRIAVITSPTGAAIRDFLRVIHRRFVNMEVIILPVKVQGEGAAAEMIEALSLINERLDVDVIVLTRGGGSLEDLWAFNQEELALAIRESKIPVVSAVGHEIDITISDLAADLRAPTPSAAAELLVDEKEVILKRLHDLRRRLKSNLSGFLNRKRELLESHSKRLADPRRKLSDSWLRLDEFHEGLLKRMEGYLKERRSRLNFETRTILARSPQKYIMSLSQKTGFLYRSLFLLISRQTRENRMALSLFEGKLEGLSPFAVLNRGYSITRKLPGKSVVKKAGQVMEGDRLQILLSEGELESSVEKIKPERSR
jgi:exodeoxyribonuclease VII large subunit